METTMHNPGEPGYRPSRLVDDVQSGMVFASGIKLPILIMSVYSSGWSKMVIEPGLLKETIEEGIKMSSVGEIITMQLKPES